MAPAPLANARGPPGPPGLRPDPSCMRAWAPLGPFLRTPRPPLAPGPLPPRGAASARRARRRYAGPVRRFRPRAPPSPGPPRTRAPRLPRSASCALPRSVGTRCRRLPAGPPSRRCGLPVRSPLLCLGLALVQRVGPPGPPARPLGGLRPSPRPLCGRPSGFGGGGSGPGGLCGPTGRFFGPRPRGLGLRARACAGLLGASVASAVVVVGLSPAAPRPAAPAGGSREHGAQWGSAPLGGAFFAPLSRAPSALRARPCAGFPARLTVLKLSTGLHKACGWGFPRRRFSHYPARVKAPLRRGLRSQRRRRCDARPRP